MSRKRSKTHPAARQPRPARRIHEEEPGKHPEGSSCPECGASYHKGRWTWDQGEAFHQQLCPACERIASDYPAAVLHLGGGFAAAHRDEIEGLLRNFEERERAAHPLRRIMAITDEDAGFAVTVTDASLAQSLGRALESAYEGRLEHPPTTSETQNLVRIRWMRD